jgi:hypothetical protein
MENSSSFLFWLFDVGCSVWVGFSGHQAADNRQQTTDNRRQTTDTRQQNFGHQDEVGGWLEERVQRERLVGREERTGGRMPRETHKAVRDAQRENGIIWRKEEV